jgi:hypothetical protein
MTAPRKHEFSPTPSEVLRYFLVWLRGFHKDREKSKAADWAMVGLTALGLIAAVASAIFLYMQLRDAQDNFRIDERAWVELEPINVIHRDGRKVYEFFPKNVGKTVAHDVRMKLVHFPAYAYKIQNSEIDCIHRVLEQTASSRPDTMGEMREMLDKTGGMPSCNWFVRGVYQGAPDTENQRIPSVIADNEKVITPSVVYIVEPLPDRQAPVFVGRIDYVDSFGIPHWKKFCIYEELDEFLSCKTGNEEDQHLD